jgi:hypothetical protein
MLLRSLKGPLEILYAVSSVDSDPDVVDPSNLGLAVTQAFIVDLRGALLEMATAGGSYTVELPFLGAFSRMASDDIEFKPSELLNFHGPKRPLWDFVLSVRDLIDFDQVKAALFEDQGLLNVAYRNSDGACPGQALIAKMCTLLIRCRAAKDPGLKKSLQWAHEAAPPYDAQSHALEVICRVVHDAIVFGPGITLETLGTFSRQGTTPPFQSDTELRELLAFSRQRRPNSTAANGERRRSRLIWSS